MGSSLNKGSLQSLFSHHDFNNTVPISKEPTVPYGYILWGTENNLPPSFSEFF